jgi:tetratricopeptide (TPR) repeat protein
MALKGTRKNTKTIGRELDVQYVLEGSVRKSGNDLRITAQLINARDDVHLWAEKYGGTLDDIFKIQENVSRSIVDALKIRLSLYEEQKVSERPIDNVQAYECYLKANYEIWRCTEESLSRAIKLLQEGIDIVGDNELLLAAMGMVYFQYVNVGIRADEKYLDKAESYVQKTFKMNPDSAHGYVLIGMINETRGKFYDAVNDTRKALESNSNDPMALLMLGFLYAIAGKSAAAKPLNDRLMKIDPLNHINLWLPWWIHISEGEFGLTREIVKRMYERDSANPAIQLCYAWSLVWEQQNKEAFKIIDDIEKDAPQSIPCSFGLFMKHAVKGEKEKAIRSLSEEAVKLAKIDHIYSWFAAQFYSLLDMKKEALDYLENAVKRGRIDYPFLSKRDPLLENIRGEPRYKKLMERVKHEWESFEV